MQRFLAAALAGGGLLWCAAIVLAPLAVSGGNPRWSWPGAIVYQVAGLICHQRPERSFHLAGIQLPVCARCAGLYVSGAAAAVAAMVLARQRTSSPDRRLLLVAAALPTAATVGLEFFGLIYPSNIVRAVSALPLGAGAGWVFVRMLLDESAGRAPGFRAR